MKKITVAIFTFCFVFFTEKFPLFADSSDKNYVLDVFGTKYTYDEVKELDRAFFYDLEQKKYDKINQIAKEKYIEKFWLKKAKDLSVSAEKAAFDYMKEKTQISEMEIKQTLQQFKNHPKLNKLSMEEKTKQIKDYLISRKRSLAMEEIISNGLRANNITILYPKPQQPIYKLEIDDNDEIRYGPKDEVIAHKGCNRNKCAITVVEYSEFQCPFCARAIPTINRVLSEYKGNIRWIVRDFPLSFHDRAKPAAIAARCAGFQGKFWSMYTLLFKDQKNLTDDNFFRYAKEIKLNSDDFKNCYKNSQKAKDIVEKNFVSGTKLGVTGTPAFFINGRRISGALPFEEFKKIIDEELEKLKIDGIKK